MEEKTTIEEKIFKKELENAVNHYGITLSPGQEEQFRNYYALLLARNREMNLTAITEPQEFAAKHIADSLSAYEEEDFPEGALVIDVGTGAGFPGLPLKILRPDLRLTLLDSLQKRVKFLQDVSFALGLAGVSCVHGRAEDVAREEGHREQFDVAISRAVARLPVLAEYCLPFVKPGGVFLALKGMRYAEEMQEAERPAKLLGGGKPKARPVTLPGRSDVRAIISIEKLRATPKGYPRKAGVPAKKPLR